MSEWHCLHLKDTLTAMAIADRGRFLVRLREPAGENRSPVEFHRWTLKDAKAYYPHDCGECGCGEWEEL
jgi:hypothetical protein